MECVPEDSRPAVPPFRRSAARVISERDVPQTLPRRRGAARWPRAADVSMVGYLRGTHAGAISYNIVHNWATGGLVLGLGAALAAPALVFAGIILIAHVGMDRLFGYGLKYPTSFQDTHLGRIGKRR